jgi:hypothetical protein
MGTLAILASVAIATAVWAAPGETGPAEELASRTRARATAIQPGETIHMAQSNGTAGSKPGPANPAALPGTISSVPGQAPPKPMTADELNAAQLKAKPAERNAPLPPVAGGKRSDAPAPTPEPGGGPVHIHAGSQPLIPQIASPPPDLIKKALDGK